jgi:hypothetical protein
MGNSDYQLSTLNRQHQQSTVNCQPTNNKQRITLGWVTPPMSQTVKIAYVY